MELVFLRFIYEAPGVKKLWTRIKKGQCFCKEKNSIVDYLHLSVRFAFCLIDILQACCVDLFADPE